MIMMKMNSRKKQITVHPRQAEQRQEHVQYGDDEQVVVLRRALLQPEMIIISFEKFRKVPIFENVETDLFWLLLMIAEVMFWSMKKRKESETC